MASIFGRCFWRFAWGHLSNMDMMITDKQYTIKLEKNGGNWYGHQCNGQIKKKCNIIISFENVFQIIVLLAVPINLNEVMASFHKLTSDTKNWWFICCYAEQVVDQTMNLPENYVRRYQFYGVIEAIRYQLQYYSFNWLTFCKRCTPWYVIYTNGLFMYPVAKDCMLCYAFLQAKLCLLNDLRPKSHQKMCICRRPSVFVVLASGR